MRTAPTRIFEWCLFDTAVATASWASGDLDEFLEWTVSVNCFYRDNSRADGKRQLARCSRKTRHKFAIASMAKKFLHCAQARMHRCMCIFSEEYACIQTGVVSTMHVQVCMLKRCCQHQRTHLRTRSVQGVHMRFCLCSLFIQRWGTRVKGFN